MAIRVYMLSVLLLLLGVALHPASATSRPSVLPVLIPLKAPAQAPAFINVTILTPPNEEQNKDKITLPVSG